MSAPVATFARARPEHADRVGARVRESDRVELAALGIEDVPARLRMAIALDGDARAVLVDGEAVALIGCAERGPGQGAPWMICADDIERARRLIVKHCPRWVRAWKRRWAALANATHADNALHHRFIEHCGFTWTGDVEVNGHSFRTFAYV